MGNQVTDTAQRDAVDLSRHIGDLTDEQIAEYQAQGWVYVPGFVAPELCEEVIEHFMQWSGLRWRDWPSDPDEQKQFRDAVDNFGMRAKRTFAIRQDDPWMFNYITQRKFGEASARLLQVPAIKTLSETLQVKYPSVSDRARPVNWHQDYPSIPIDRAEAVQFWLALIPITPEMGPMVHLSGSHRSAPGGMVGETGEDARQLYPDLWKKYEVSKPRHYNPGDAVFHSSLTWHASGPNLTNKVRWAMSSYRISARSRYTGQANHNTDGLGLEPRELFDHPNFPTVYP